MTDNKSFRFKIKDNLLEFKINTKIYSLSAVYQAAYLFLDKVYIFLDGDPKKEVVVIMKEKSSFASASAKAMADKKASEDKEPVDLEKIAGEFYNELLNQLLREKVSQTNAKIREYIVSQALYNAVPNEVDELLKEVEEEDWQEDPLGIAKTWEEQNLEGKKSKKGKMSKKGK